MSRGVLLALSTVFAERGGIPRFNQMLCLALDRAAPRLDLDVVVLSIDDDHEHYEAAGRPWRHLRFRPGKGMRGIVLRSLAEAARMRPEIMIVGIVGMTPAGLLCRPALRRGYGFIAHGMEVWQPPRRGRRLSGRLSSFAIAVSTDTSRQVTRHVGVPPERVLLLHNTLSPAFGLERPGDESVEADPPELLTVSRLTSLESHKGVDHTLHAFAALRDRHPAARYRIVGKGDDAPRLRELAASLGVADRVEFEQDLSDEALAERYRRCACFVLPSGQEGFGIVFLEAMRYGKPCIGGDAGGTPDVVDHGVTGELVPFGDRDALAAALDRMLADRERRATLGAAGWQRLHDRFTFESYCERVEGHLRRLLDIPAP